MTKCRSCNTAIIKFFSLGKMPVVNSFRRIKDTKKEKKYDLSVGFCPNCYLVQIMKNISPKEIFEDYVYLSSVSQSIVNHSRETAKHLTKKLKLKKDSFVVEVGSNDGVQLRPFQDLGIQVLGIDPAKNIAKVANKEGVPTIADFFGFSLAKKLVKTKSISADLLYGANISAHVPGIVDFAKGVKTILKNNGTAVFESPYMKGLLENKFDTIYHEHVFYYSLIALQNLYGSVGLEIYDGEFIKPQGGSLRIYISHKGTYKVSQFIKNLRKNELHNKFDRISTYRKMNENVGKLKEEIIELFEKLKKDGKTIAAYSAPAKGVILLNYFGIRKYLDFIVDKSKAKQGLYVPGTDMKVLSEEEVLKKNPDYLFILCWNIKDEVVRQMSKYKRMGGRFIIPIPSVKIS